VTAALGTVLEPGSGGGIDLRAEVRVAPFQLGNAAAVIVALADALPDDADHLHTRVASPHDRPGTIALGLPAELQDGTTLRLRGQGARDREDGPVGDLYLRVILDETATALSPRASGSSTTAIMIIAGLLGSGAVFMMCG
jgi:hypothetical protein